MLLDIVMILLNVLWWIIIVQAVMSWLLAFNVINNRLAPQGHYLLWAFGGSFGVLAIGLLDGNSWTRHGLRLETSGYNLNTALAGEGEEAWAKNRRVEIKDKK